MENRGVNKFERARFDRLILQREFENEILRRRKLRAEADGQKSDGENEQEAE